MSEFTDWSKLPTDLQHQFFALAEDESRKRKKELLEQAEKLKAFGRFLSFQRVLEDHCWKGWRIACVDGSSSPSTSERMGARYGACCAGYMIFEGNELVGESYNSDYLTQEQIGDPDVSSQILMLLTTRLERELAQQCLKEGDIDLLIVDGAFFGYRAKLSQIRNIRIDLKGHKTVGRLADYITDLSVKVMNSGKAVGVVKRVRTNAFDGWLIRKYGDERQCLGRNDRAILSTIMPPQSWFAYEWLFQHPTDFNFYTTLRTVFEEMGVKRDVAEAEAKARELVAKDVNRSLRRDAEEVLRTSRYYLRCNNAAPPFCFETLVGVDVKPILAYFQSNHNPATGLPFPLDLVDENVSLPEGFTKEFVEEVEALLIKDPELDKYDLSNQFLSINPQKEE